MLLILSEYCCTDIEVCIHRRVSDAHVRRDLPYKDNGDDSEEETLGGHQVRSAVSCTDMSWQQSCTRHASLEATAAPAC